MSILVDANVLIDVMQARQDHHSEWAVGQISQHAEAAPFIINVVIAAEVAFQFRSEAETQERLSGDVWLREPLPFEAAFPAAQAHRLYRERGGRRDRTLPDFLIGAHALVGGHRLLTRDPARYRAYFPDLDIIAPDTHP